MSGKINTAMATTLALLSFAGVAKAQEVPADPPAATSSSRAVKRTVTSYTEKWAKDTGATILVDASTSKQMVTLPATVEEATGETLEAGLTSLIKRLPPGTTWAKLYLPAGRSLNADAVADYAVAQAHLFGGVGLPTPPGTIEVLGQKVSGDKAEGVSTALNLRTVYIVLNQNRSAGATGITAVNDWGNMTDEQKKDYAQKQAQALLAMDPKQQQQAMASIMDQQRQVMQSLMQSMSPEQRQQFFQNMRQAMGGMFPGGGGGGRGGRGGGNGGNNLRP
jgi:hypothetical protein